MPYDDQDDLDISIHRDGDRHRGTPDIPNYLVQAILVTICCGCWPLGIVAIVQAAKVNGLIAQGDYEGARRASDSAKMWCIISLVAGIIGTIAAVALQILAEGPGRRF